MAAVIVGSKATVVAAQEIGTTQLADLLRALGPTWQGRKAVGLNGNGLNAVLWRTDWTLSDVEDWNLPSYGQMQRTLIVCHLTQAGRTLEVGSTHFAAAASDLTKAQANAAKYAQVNYVAGLLAGRTIIVGADLARADDDDDLAYLTGRGWSLNGRTDTTPQVSFSLGQITVNAATTVPTGAACDHAAALTTITI